MKEAEGLLTWPNVSGVIARRTYVPRNVPLPSGARPFAPRRSWLILDDLRWVRCAAAAVVDDGTTALSLISSIFCPTLEAPGCPAFLVYWPGPGVSNDEKRWNRFEEEPKGPSSLLLAVLFSNEAAMPGISYCPGPMRELPASPAMACPNLRQPVTQNRSQSDDLGKAGSAPFMGFASTQHTEA